MGGSICLRHNISARVTPRSVSHGQPHKLVSEGDGAILAEKERRKPFLKDSSRVSGSGGHGHALETYDFVEIYSQNPPARRKPFTPLKWKWAESNRRPDWIVAREGAMGSGGT